MHHNLVISEWAKNEKKYGLLWIDQFVKYVSEKSNRMF